MKVLLKKYGSYSLNIIFLIVIIIFSLPDEKAVVVDLNDYTQNDLKQSINIENDMSFEEVLKIMGKPALKEISGDFEEYHYCSTGKVVDEYISIKLQNGKVLSMSYYVVNALDVAFNHTPTPSDKMLDLTNFGDCKLTIRWGTYGKRTPNINTYVIDKK